MRVHLLVCLCGGQAAGVSALLSSGIELKLSGVEESAFTHWVKSPTLARTLESTALVVPHKHSFHYFKVFSTFYYEFSFESMVVWKCCLIPCVWIILKFLPANALQINFTVFWEHVSYDQVYSFGRLVFWLSLWLILGLFQYIRKEF